MITENPLTWQSQTRQSVWQRELQQAICDPLELLDILTLPRTSFPDLRLNTPRFNLRVPRDYVARMRKGDVHDPLLRQVLPLIAETHNPSIFTHDPVGDSAATRVPGLIHKYHGRILIVMTGACAIHCRYCFRQHFPYGETPSRLSADVLDILQTDESLEEVIFSGGDPLSLTDLKLKRFIDELEKIPHLQRLRIHTRLPIVLPSRVTSTLVSALQQSRLQGVMVVHVNHPQELDKKVIDCLKQLADSGVTLLNQAVLLREINDDAATLAELSKILFQARVMPYYLNMLDKVQGAAHFEVSLADARALMRQLRTQLPGYLVPQLVQEIAGKAYKQPIL